MVVAKTIDDLQSAITSQTAMVYTTWRDERLAKHLKITKRCRGSRCCVDDAGRYSPIDNFTRYAKMGVDLFCFSGGKGLSGPQCSGVLLGRKDLIDAALANSCPGKAPYAGR